MKKTGQYLLCFMLIVMMVLAVGCGRRNTGTTDGKNQTNQTTAAMETTGGGNGSLNGPTNGVNGTAAADGTHGRVNEESTGVLEGVADDVRNGADDLLNGAENAIDGRNGTVNETTGGAAGQTTGRTTNETARGTER